MKSHAKIYTRAADLLESGTGFCGFRGCGWACCALSAAVGRSASEEQYRAVQRPFRDRFLLTEWWGNECTPERQRARVAALREMAELVKEAA